MLGRRGTLLVVLAALGGGVVLASSATAGPTAKEASYPVAQNGRIVFTAQPTGNGQSQDVHIANVGGSGDINLTPNGNIEDYGPSLSPDGTRVAFARDTKDPAPNGFEPTIMVMNVDGSGLTDLTPSSSDDDEPAFSPDGKRIVFISYPDEDHGDISVMNADGSSRQNLTNTPSTDEVYPEFSPDGTRIVFDKDVDPGTGFSEHVIVMNADGSGQTDLGPGFGPGFSPDGKRIAFARDVAGTTLVALINTDGSGYAELPATANRFTELPRFSPDGTKILFDFDVDPGAPIFRHLMVVNSDGSGLTDTNTTPAGGDTFDGEWESVYMCKGRRATIVGSDASEKLKGTKKADVIVGNGGKDKIYGKGGNDRLCGGAGKDKLIGGKGKDKLSGGPGKDQQKQ